MAGLVFTTEEYMARMERAQRAVAAQGLDGLIVTLPENMCYLTGFSTPGYHVFQALVLPASRPPFLVIRNIEVDNVKEKSWVSNYYAIENLDQPLRSLADAMKAEQLGRGRIGVELDPARLSVTSTDMLSEVLPGCTFVPTAGTVEALRAVKSAGELAYIRQAVAIAEKGMLAGVQSLPNAATDSDVAAAVHAALAANGSEYTGSPSYIVGGVASAITHASHARRHIGPREHVWLEVSASVQRYQGAISRIAGLDLTPETQKVFEGVVAALTAMIETARDGVTAGEVDAAGRAAAERHGVLQYWKNRAAYSLGLSYPPGLGEGHVIDIKPRDPRILRAGMVFHMIPIMKVPGVGAVGCTETVLITERGGERLGTLPLTPLTPR